MRYAKSGYVLGFNTYINKILEIWFDRPFKKQQI